MSLTKQNITSEQASKLNLSLQVSHSALQYCIMSDSKIEQADIRKFNRDKSTEENLSVLFGALPALNLPYKNAAIILATEKVCLVPDGLADGDALAYMHANGIQVEKDEQLLHSSSNGITAIMAAPTFLVQKAQTLYGDHTHWLHPLKSPLPKPTKVRHSKLTFVTIGPTSPSRMIVYVMPKPYLVPRLPICSFIYNN